MSGAVVVYGGFFIFVLLLFCLCLYFIFKRSPKRGAPDSKRDE